MNKNNLEIKDTILKIFIDDVPFTGWNWDGLLEATTKANYPTDTAIAVFPDKLNSVAAHFSDWADRNMLDHLIGIDNDDLKIRTRIKTASMARFKFLQPYKESVRASLSYQCTPSRKINASQYVWKTADCIWQWAGDTAKDYNHYTKRTLLSGIIASTTLVWLNDDSKNLQKTSAFLDRRIENVMLFGKFKGKLTQWLPFTYKTKKQGE